MLLVAKTFEECWNKNEEKTKLILWNADTNEEKAQTNSEKYNSLKILNRISLIDFVNQNFTCQKLDKIEEFEFSVGRNFFNHKENKTKFVLYRFNC